MVPGDEMTLPPDPARAWKARCGTCPIQRGRGAYNGGTARRSEVTGSLSWTRRRKPAPGTLSIPHESRSLCCGAGKACTEECGLPAIGAGDRVDLFPAILVTQYGPADHRTKRVAEGPEEDSAQDDRPEVAVL
jgi:hypothetical protein